MKTLLFLLAVTLTSCATHSYVTYALKDPSGKEFYEPVTIRYEQGEPLKWKSPSSPEWKDVEQPSVADTIK